MGFEPTPPERLEPKSSALDHSATLPRFFFFALPPSGNRGNTGRGDSSQKPSSAAKESSLLGYGSHKSLPRRLSWQQWDSNPAPEETGALIQHLRPLGPLPPFFFLSFHPPEIEATLAAEILHKNHRVRPRKALCSAMAATRVFQKGCPGSSGIRTHAPKETGALIQRLRPLSNATLWVLFHGSLRPVESPDADLLIKLQSNPACVKQT